MGLRTGPDLQGFHLLNTSLSVLKSGICRKSQEIGAKRADESGFWHRQRLTPRPLPPPHRGILSRRLYWHAGKVDNVAVDVAWGADMGRGPAKGSSPKKKKPSARKAPATAQKRAAKGANNGANKPARRRASPAAGLKADAAGLAKELAEARARQAATSDILRVINQSPANAQPVF